MTYDLYGWKQTDECRKAPLEIMDGLFREKDLNGLKRLPIQDLVQKFKEEFPEIREVKLQAGEVPIELVWESPEDGSGFLIDWGSHHFEVDCGGVDSDTLLRIADVAAKFGCTVYDPQIDEVLTD